MTADPGTSGIPAVGTVTKANADTLLTDQLAAVAAFSMDLTADEDDWLEPFSTENGQSSSAFLSRRRKKAGKTAGQAEGSDPNYHAKHGEDRRQAA